MPWARAEQETAFGACQRAAVAAKNLPVRPSPHGLGPCLAFLPAGSDGAKGVSWCREGVKASDLFDPGVKP